MQKTMQKTAPISFGDIRSKLNVEFALFYEDTVEIPFEHSSLHGNEEVKKQILMTVTPWECNSTENFKTTLVIVLREGNILSAHIELIVFPSDNIRGICESMGLDEESIQDYLYAAEIYIKNKAYEFEPCSCRIAVTMNDNEKEEVLNTLIGVV